MKKYEISKLISKYALFGIFALVAKDEGSHIKELPSALKKIPNPINENPINKVKKEVEEDIHHFLTKIGKLLDKISAGFMVDWNSGKHKFTRDLNSEASKKEEHHETVEDNHTKHWILPSSVKGNLTANLFKTRFNSSISDHFFIDFAGAFSVFGKSSAEIAKETNNNDAKGIEGHHHTIGGFLFNLGFLKHAKAGLVFGLRKGRLSYGFGIYFGYHTIKVFFKKDASNTQNILDDVEYVLSNIAVGPVVKYRFNNNVSIVLELKHHFKRTLKINTIDSQASNHEAHHSMWSFGVGLEFHKAKFHEINFAG